MQREQAKVSRYAKVTGGRDCKTSPLESVPLMTTFEFTRHIAEKGFNLFSEINNICKVIRE